MMACICGTVKVALLDCGPPLRLNSVVVRCCWDHSWSYSASGCAESDARWRLNKKKKNSVFLTQAGRPFLRLAGLIFLFWVRSRCGGLIPNAMGICV